MEKLIEQIKLKADSIPTNTKENRRAKGAYVDCLIMVKKASKNFIGSDVCRMCGKERNINMGLCIRCQMDMKPIP